MLKTLKEKIIVCTVLSTCFGTCLGVKIADYGYKISFDETKEKLSKYPKTEIMAKYYYIQNGDTIIEIKKIPARIIPDTMLSNLGPIP